MNTVVIPFVWQTEEVTAPLGKCSYEVQATLNTCKAGE